MLNNSLQHFHSYLRVNHDKSLRHFEISITHVNVVHSAVSSECLMQASILLLSVHYNNNYKYYMYYNFTISRSSIKKWLRCSHVCTYKCSAHTCMYLLAAAQGEEPSPRGPQLKNSNPSQEFLTLHTDLY